MMNFAGMARLQRFKFWKIYLNFAPVDSAAEAAAAEGAAAAEAAAVAADA